MYSEHRWLSGIEPHGEPVDRVNHHQPVGPPKPKGQVPTARHHAARGCSKYPLGLYSPHARAGIDGNWRANEHLLRPQRGDPHVYINPTLAKVRGIDDGVGCALFNSPGEFSFRAIYPNAPEDGIVLIDQDRCQGDSHRIASCPCEKILCRGWPAGRLGRLATVVPRQSAIWATG